MLLGRTDELKLDPKMILPSTNYSRYFEPENSLIVSLAENIAQYGQKQAVIVQKIKGKDEYRLCSGFNRYRAITLINSDPELRALAGLGNDDIFPIKAVSVQPTQEEAIITNIVENAHRADLSSVDQAHAHEQLRGLGLAGKEIAKICNCSEGWVSQLKGVLQLPQEILLKVHRGELSVANAMYPKPPKRSISVASLRKISDEYADIPLMNTLYEFLSGDIDEAALRVQLDAILDATVGVA